LEHDDRVLCFVQTVQQLVTNPIDLRFGDLLGLWQLGPRFSVFGEGRVGAARLDRLEQKPRARVVRLIVEPRKSRLPPAYCVVDDLPPDRKPVVAVCEHNDAELLSSEGYDVRL